MKIYYYLFTILIAGLSVIPAGAQTLEEVVILPNEFPYNNLYTAYTMGQDAFVLASASTSQYIGEIRKFNIVDGQIVVIATYQTGMRECRGIHWDGEYYWASFRRALGQPFRIYQFNTNFELLDSLDVPQGELIHGVYAEEDGIWYTIFWPRWTGIKKVSKTTGAEIDSIHNVQGGRPAGITYDGIYYYYSIEGIDGELELIYIYDHAIKDTVGSIMIPEADAMRKRLTNIFYANQKLYAVAASPGTSHNPRAIYIYDLEGEGTPAGNVTPATYNFSHTIIGTDKSLNVNINSTGTANLVIDSVYVSDPDNFTFPIDLPLVIGPDDTEIIELTYAPQTYGEDFAEIKLFTNDPAGLVKTVTVEGYGIFLEPNIALSPAVYDFGDKRVGSTSLLNITINNRGSQPLVISDITNTLTDIFYLDVEPDYPVQIDSTSSYTIRVWFHPDATTDYDDDLILSSNASNEPSYEMELSGTGIAVTFAIGDKVWQSIIPDNPETGWQYRKTTAARSIDDISGDGLADVIMSTENYWLIAYNGASSGTGDILWKFNTALDNNNTGKVEGPNALRIAPDLDGDGYPDIIAGYGGGNNHVYAISGRTGEVIWAFGSETEWWDGNIMGVDITRDYNNDGTLDVLAAASGNESTGEGRFSVYALSGEDGSEIWSFYVGKLMYDVVSTEHGGAAGARQAGFTAGEVVGFDQNGNATWTYATYRAPWSLVELQGIPGGSGSDIAFVEIFSGAGNPGAAVSAIRGDNGQQLWETFVSAPVLSELRVVPDMNNDGVNDIILTGTTSFILLSGATGDVIWHKPMHGWSFAVDMVGDLTGDGYTEFAAVDYGGGGSGSPNYFYIFRGTNGDILHEEVIGTGNNTPGEAVAGVADVTFNGYPEIAVGTRDGRVMLFAGVQLEEELDPPGQVMLSFPEDESTVTVHEDTLAAELGWYQAFPQVTRYHLDIALDSDFTDVVLSDTTITDTSYVFTDIEDGETYWWRARAKNDAGWGPFSAVWSFDVLVTDVPGGPDIPTVYSLSQNYPNPFNPSTVIKYGLPERSTVRLEMYNSIGQRVAVLLDEEQEAGYHRFEWFAGRVASGVYFYRLEAVSVEKPSNRFTEVKSMIFLK